MSGLNPDPTNVSKASAPTGREVLAPVSPGRKTDSPRVLMVTPRFLPRVGGTEIHTYELSRRLQARGVDVTVLTVGRESSQVGSESRYGFPVIHVKAWPKRRDWSIAPGIARVVAAGRWDLVHVQGIHTMVLPVAIGAARHAQLPYLITLHSGGHSSALRRRLRVLVWKALRPWIRAAKRLVAVSEFERTRFSGLLSVPPERISVIPSGAELPSPHSRSSAAAEAWDHDSVAPLIVSVGRLEAYKGHDRVVRALPSVAAQYPGARLVIVGSGPRERSLRRLAAKLGVGERIQIVNIPAERRSQLHDLFDQADLVVALSAYESQGLGAMEAVGRGCSVLVAEGSALSELVAKGYARGVPLTSTEELAAAIVQQLQEPHHPAAVLPTWEECAAKTHALYLSLLWPSVDARA